MARANSGTGVEPRKAKTNRQELTAYFRDDPCRECLLINLLLS
jgi:hypothetical protein